MNRKHAKTIKLFLLDGDPEGRMVCELSNWAGKAYRLPRSSIKDSGSREDLKATAVYLLFGRADGEGKARVYIGEAENAVIRLNDHVSNKEFWNEAVVFLSKDENLNKAHIKYLESRLYEIAKDTDRFELQNGNTPTKSSISESDEAEMEEFIDYIRILINVMGYKVFEPFVTAERIENDASSILYINSARGANGRSIITSEGCVVLEGSEVAVSTVPSTPVSTIKLRESLQGEGIIIEKEGKLIFAKNYVFSSPSTAAAIVMGRSANGLIEWKNGDGIELRKLDQNG